MGSDIAPVCPIHCVAAAPKVMGRDSSEAIRPNHPDNLRFSAELAGPSVQPMLHTLLHQDRPWASCYRNSFARRARLEPLMGPEPLFRVKADCALDKTCIELG